jgi:hypothetical protein
MGSVATPHRLDVPLGSSCFDAVRRPICITRTATPFSEPALRCSIEKGCGAAIDRKRDGVTDATGDSPWILTLSGTSCATNQSTGSGPMASTEKLVLRPSANSSNAILPQRCLVQCFLLSLEMRYLCSDVAAR